MVQRVSTVAFEGIEARAVDVQVQVAPGLPAFKIVWTINLANVVRVRRSVSGELWDRCLVPTFSRITHKQACGLQEGWQQPRQAQWQQGSFRGTECGGLALSQHPAARVDEWPEPGPPPEAGFFFLRIG
jgi:hypothetical protein